MIAGVTHHLALRDVLHADALRGTDALIRHRTSPAPGARSAPDPAPAGVASGPPAPPGLPAPWSAAPDTAARTRPFLPADQRSEEHTSELQSLMRISYAVFCLK